MGTKAERESGDDRGELHFDGTMDDGFSLGDQVDFLLIGRDEW